MELSEHLLQLYMLLSWEKKEKTETYEQKKKKKKWQVLF